MYCLFPAPVPFDIFIMPFDISVVPFDISIVSFDVTINIVSYSFFCSSATRRVPDSLVIDGVQDNACSRLELLWHIIGIYVYLDGLSVAKT